MGLFGTLFGPFEAFHKVSMMPMTHIIKPNHGFPISVKNETDQIHNKLFGKADIDEKHCFGQSGALI